MQRQQLTRLLQIWSCRQREPKKRDAAEADMAQKPKDPASWNRATLEYALGQMDVAGPYKGLKDDVLELYRQAVLDKQAKQQQQAAFALVQGSVQAPCAADPSTDAAISSSSSTEPLLLLGRRVEKLFGGKSFSGLVDSYDEKKKWFRVKYDDDDTEEYTRKELEPLLLELPASEPSDDLQAESDDDAPLSMLMGKQIAPLDQQSPLALPLPVSE